MKRREFICLVGGAAAWPVMAWGQERLRRIGVLMGQAATDPVSQARNAAFLQGLQELGWAVGRNLRIDYRWSPGDLGRLRKDATELVGLHPEVILAAAVLLIKPLWRLRCSALPVSAPEDDDLPAKRAELSRACITMRIIVNRPLTRACHDAHSRQRIEAHVHAAQTCRDCRER